MAGLPADSTRSRMTQLGYRNLRSRLVISVVQDFKRASPAAGVRQMDYLSAFGKFAPYLANPLVLIGFVILLFFSIHRMLIKSGIIPPVARTEAPKLVRLILGYGFAIAITIIVLGLVYALLKTYVSEVVQKHVQLAVVDFTQEPDSTFDIKLKNSGTDTAFVNEVRIAFFKGAAGNTSCMPVPFEYYGFPLEVRILDSKTDVERGEPIKDEFMKPASRDDEPLGLLRRDQHDAYKPFRKPIWITQPLKVSQKVPPGDVDRFKIHFEKTKPITMPMKECNWSVEFTAYAIIFYDGGKFVTTDNIYLRYKAADLIDLMVNGPPKQSSPP